jgi:hypothetical protein
MHIARDCPRQFAKIMIVRDLIIKDMLVENLTERDSHNSIWIEKQSKWLETLKPRALVEIILKPLIKNDQDLVLALQNKNNIEEVDPAHRNLSMTSSVGIVLLHAHIRGRLYRSDIAEIALDLDLLKRLQCQEIYIDLLRKEENDRLIVPALQTLRLKVLKDSQPPIPSLNPRLR